jgi:hypothetical protein
MEIGEEMDNRNTCIDCIQVDGERERENENEKMQGKGWVFRCCYAALLVEVEGMIGDRKGMGMKRINRKNCQLSIANFHMPIATCHCGLFVVSRIEE